MHKLQGAGAPCGVSQIDIRNSGSSRFRALRVDLGRGRDQTKDVARDPQTRTSVACPSCGGPQNLTTEPFSGGTMRLGLECGHCGLATSI